MNLISFARRVASVAVVLGAAGTSAAPCPTCAAPVGTPCGPSCTAAAKGCKTHFGRTVMPFQAKLCPGACFGYFQTQWSRWEEVCPLPHQGQGLTDAPAARTTPVAPVTPVRPPSTEPKKHPEPKPIDQKFNKDGKNGELLPPRPSGTGTVPMPVGRGTGIPQIPQIPQVPAGRIGS